MIYWIYLLESPWPQAASVDGSGEPKSRKKMQQSLEWIYCKACKILLRCHHTKMQKDASRSKAKRGELARKRETWN